MLAALQAKQVKQNGSVKVEQALQESTLQHHQSVEVEPHSPDTPFQRGAMRRGKPISAADVRFIESWSPLQEAKCELEMQTVLLTTDNIVANNGGGIDIDNILRIIPKGVRPVRRCGGFCDSDAKTTCQPTEVVKRTMQALAVTLDNEGQTVEIEVEEHLGCQCQCPVKPQECSPKHKYEDCGCVCKDVETMMMCRTELWDTHYWDEDECRCTCKERTHECSTGSYFDQNTCRYILQILKSTYVRT